MRFGAIDMDFPPAALLGALFVGVLLLAELAGMRGILVVGRFAEGKGRVVGYSLDIVVHEATVDVDHFISNPLHSSFCPITDQTTVLLRGQRRTLASLAEKFTDPIGLHGETGFEVVATFMDTHEASTAQQDLQPLFDPTRDHLLEGDETPPALATEDRLEGRTVLQLMLITHSIYYWRESTYIFTGTHTMYDAPDEEDRLCPPTTHSIPTPRQGLYLCHLCQRTASHPVLPPCGHLHWYSILYPAGSAFTPIHSVPPAAPHALNRLSSQSFSTRPITKPFTPPSRPNRNPDTRRKSRIRQGCITTITCSAIECRITWRMGQNWQGMGTSLHWPYTCSMIWRNLREM